MTPEETEQRFRRLEIPMPPDRLRERCLEALARGRQASGSAGARWSPALALAASFLVFALIAWLVATSRPAGRSSAQEPGLAKFHLPAFTFRTMDHQPAKVFINGLE